MQECLWESNKPIALMLALNFPALSGFEVEKITMRQFLLWLVPALFVVYPELKASSTDKEKALKISFGQDTLELSFLTIIS